jgi:hypothetical protein
MIDLARWRESRRRYLAWMVVIGSHDKERRSISVDRLAPSSSPARPIVADALVDSMPAVLGEDCSYLVYLWSMENECL